MFNYCLLSRSYAQTSVDAIEKNLRILNDLVVDEREHIDTFLMCNSIWNTETTDGQFYDIVFSKLTDKQFMYQVLPRMFQGINHADTEIDSFEIFDKLHELYNAFYGINFANIDLERCIQDKSTYVQFRERKLWDVTPKIFWDRRELLFSNLIFCKEVEANILSIGGTYLEQIITKLKELNSYVRNHWLDGSFSYNDANQKCAVNISPESKSTMDSAKHKNMRMFGLPDGRRECFELHIKTGDLRFHFFPENKKVYIGYIGKHLETVTF